MPHFIFIQQISVLNILNMLYNLQFFSSKCCLFHNATFFGFCITHILNTGCAKIWKKIRRQNVKTIIWQEFLLPLSRKSISFPAPSSIPMVAEQAQEKMYLPKKELKMDYAQSSLNNKIPSSQLPEEINPLNTKRRPLYLKTQFVPRSKHFSSQL